MPVPTFLSVDDRLSIMENASSRRSLDLTNGVAVMVPQAPSLPHCVWHAISLLVMGEATRPTEVLQARVKLMLICREVAAALRAVPLSLDLRCTADFVAVKALLAAAPVSRLWLRRDMRGDEILRDPAMRQCSASSLRELSASISCTDTLQEFRSLRMLHLEAYVLPKLYPAVLWGVVGLQRLSLHHFEEYCFTELPAPLVSSLRVIDVTPKPVALHSKFALRLPAAMALTRLSVNGSFYTITSQRAAPSATLDVAAMCQQCQEVVIEAEDIVFQLPVGTGTTRNGLDAFVDTLLQPCSPHGRPPAWQRLEFRLLGNVIFQAPSSGGSAASLGDEQQMVVMKPAVFIYKLRHALLGVADARIRVTFQHWQCSIFHPTVIEVACVL